MKMNVHQKLVAVYVAICAIGILTGCQTTEEHPKPGGQLSEAIPHEFIGKWRGTEDGAGDLVISVNSITWRRKEEGQETFSGSQYTMADIGRKIVLKATEIAYWDLATGEKPRREIQVELTRDGENLLASIAPTQTRVGSSNLAASSPARRYVYERR